VSGHVVVGSALGCLPGSWTGNPSFGVTWLRDGRGIGTAHGLSYTPTLADAGHAIQCEVTATNANGSAIAASPAVLVPIPRPPRPALGGAPVKLAHGRAPVLAGCIGVPGQRCTATLRLTVTSGTGRHRRTTTVGSTRATVAVSQRLVTVRVPLTSAGKRLVNAAKHHRLTVTASFGSASRALTLQG
jgi:hypothetical protein